MVMLQILESEDQRKESDLKIKTKIKKDLWLKVGRKFFNLIFFVLKIDNILKLQKITRTNGIAGKPEI